MKVVLSTLTIVYLSLSLIHRQIDVVLSRPEFFVWRHRDFEPIAFSKCISCSQTLGDIYRKLQTTNKQM
jgi:hypothetical protein